MNLPESCPVCTRALHWNTVEHMQAKGEVEFPYGIATELTTRVEHYTDCHCGLAMQFFPAAEPVSDPAQGGLAL